MGSNHVPSQARQKLAAALVWPNEHPSDHQSVQSAQSFWQKTNAAERTHRRSDELSIGWMSVKHTDKRLKPFPCVL